MVPSSTSKFHNITLLHVVYLFLNIYFDLPYFDCVIVFYRMEPVDTLQQDVRLWHAESSEDMWGC